MKIVRGVLLDVDGTLLDSNDAHATSWRRALHDVGVTVSHEQVRKLVGMGADQLLPMLGLSKEEGPGEKAVARKDTIFREEFLRTLRPTRGARDLVLKLRSLGLSTVVASSSKAGDIQALLRAAGVADLILAETTASDAKASKPQPDIVQAAAERSGLPKETLVMLGDTPYDVEAARRAGVNVVCVRCGGWDDASLHGASAIYDDPQAILDGFETSVFARAARA